MIVVPVGADVKRQSGGISGYPTTIRASVGADRGREHRIGIQAGVIERSASFLAGLVGRAMGIRQPVHGLLL